jgi:hypothetical protein
MDADIHIHGFSNPGTKEIEYLFNSVGIRNIWTLFKQFEPDQVLFNSIDAIVNRRNQIAHGKAEATITLSDARTYVERTERVGTVFEKIVTSEINQRLTITDCWEKLEQIKNGAPA